MSNPALRHRLAAILAADATGYSRLMSIDDRATVAALDAARAVFREKIECSQGRVIDMAGDSVLAVFETATGAVSAALAVQEQLLAAMSATPEERRMRFRIGVHLGDVVEKADGTVYGDGVNIAARLEGLADPGGIAISESIRTAVRGKVAAEFDDLGEQTVKNITEPVRAYRVRPAGSAPGLPAPSAKPVADDGALPDKPSIAVLPFTNMSGDAEQDFFTDGVTEDIITELSRFRSLFVIARNSTFTYKGKAVDTRTVAKDLGVRYVLEGSIRKAGNRIRVTGQLIDAPTGSHVWAEKYDRVLEDIFELQEELTRSIVGAISSAVAIAEVEEARQRKRANPGAYERVLRAKGLALDALRRNDLALADQAIDEANAALALEPDNVPAFCTLAYAHWQRYFFDTAPDRDAEWRAGVDAAGRAIELDPTYEEGYRRKAQLYVVSPHGDQIDEARANAQRACEVNPNNALAHTTMGICEARVGNLAAAIEHYHLAIRLSPRDPNRPNSLLAQALTLAGDYAAAVENATQAAVEAPNSPFPLAMLAMAYVGLNNLGRARACAEALLRLQPKFLEHHEVVTEGYRDPQYAARMSTFLRVAAGVEPPEAAEALR
ncbi:MAG: adenylate/guanylate cyclase domain-containing protein [Burkholderiales bacterium]